MISTIGIIMTERCSELSHIKSKSNIVINGTDNEIIYKNKQTNKQITISKKNLTYFEYYSDEVNCELNDFLRDINADFFIENPLKN